MQPMRIAVAGATGRVGHPVVEVLEADGHDVVEISRSKGVDVITGTGLTEALVGVEAIVDAATGPSPDEVEATEFFTTAARNLQEAGERAGVERIVAVSIIGTDKFTGGYGAAKAAHEKAHLAGAIPTRVLRAAQFHEFVGQLVEWGRQDGVVSVPRMRTQLVAARTVAQALAELATHRTSTPESIDEPFPEIAGPRAENLVDAATLLLERRGDPVRIEVGSDPEFYGDEFDTGALLPGPGATLAGPTFEAWLDANGG